MSKSKLISTVAKAAAKEAVRCNAHEIAGAAYATSVGQKVITSAVNLTRDTNIYGAAARSVAGSTLKSAATAATKVNPVVAVASSAISVAPDIYSYAKGRISGKECAKRSVENAASAGASLYGAAEGAAIGTAVAGPVGTVIGVVAGVVLGDQAVRKGAAAIKKLFS